MNRGSRRLTVASLPEGYASMRPRFMNRGSHQPASLGRRCHRRFNEAPIHESGKSGLAGVRALGRAIASMRPRFMNRGSLRGLVAGVGEYGALQ